ncbi:hypothetical protein [Streptomyces sp. NPDC000994]
MLTYASRVLTPSRVSSSTPSARAGPRHLPGPLGGGSDDVEQALAPAPAVAPSAVHWPASPCTTYGAAPSRPRSWVPHPDPGQRLHADRERGGRQWGHHPLVRPGQPARQRRSAHLQRHQEQVTVVDRTAGRLVSEPDRDRASGGGDDCQGQLTSLGTYTEGLTAPYTPVSPVDCGPADDEGADPAFGVQARRVEVTAGQSWDAAAWPTLQSVTAVAHGAEGTVTTSDGPSTLHTGESATWSVARDDDARLTGPLVIKAGTGTVTVTWTHTVTL